MADRTGIEWTGSTWTPIRARHRKTGKLGWHCVHASEGCRHCYAETMNGRLGTGLPFKPGHARDIEIFLDERMLLQPLRWKQPRPIFVCSMTDLFADFVSDEMIDDIFAVMALTPQHTYQVLTKRAARMRAYVTALAEGQRRLAVDLVQFQRAYGSAFNFPCPLPNVWLGVSTEDQAAADQRVPDLLATPAAIRFVSAEPLLGPIDFTAICAGYYFIDALAGFKYHDSPQPSPTERCASLDQIIVGGESGPRARPMHPAGPRSIRDQCAAAGTAFFFKQWGEFAPTERNTKGDVVAWPNGNTSAGSANDGGGGGREMHRLGKKAAGRLLDGVEHNATPEVRP